MSSTFIPSAVSMPTVKTSPIVLTRVEQRQQKPLKRPPQLEANAYRYRAGTNRTTEEAEFDGYGDGVEASFDKMTKNSTAILSRPKGKPASPAASDSVHSKPPRWAKPATELVGEKIATNNAKMAARRCNNDWFAIARRPEDDLRFGQPLWPTMIRPSSASTYRSVELSEQQAHLDAVFKESLMMSPAKRRKLEADRERRRIRNGVLNKTAGSMGGSASRPDSRLSTGLRQLAMDARRMSVERAASEDSDESGSDDSSNFGIMIGKEPAIPVVPGRYRPLSAMSASLHHAKCQVRQQAKDAVVNLPTRPRSAMESSLLEESAFFDRCDSDRDLAASARGGKVESSYSDGSEDSDEASNGTPAQRLLRRQGELTREDTDEIQASIIRKRLLLSAAAEQSKAGSFQTPGGEGQAAMQALGLKTGPSALLQQAWSAAALGNMGSSLVSTTHGASKKAALLASVRRQYKTCRKPPAGTDAVTVWSVVHEKSLEMTPAILDEMAKMHQGNQGGGAQAAASRGKGVAVASVGRVRAGAGFPETVTAQQQRVSGAMFLDRVLD